MPRIVSKNGRVFSFPDDWSDEHVDEVIQRETKPPRFAQVMDAAPGVAWGSLAKSGGGMMQFAGDVIGNESLTQRGILAQEIGKGIIEQSTPENMSTGDEILLSGASSVLQSLSSGVAGLARGAVAKLGGATAAEAAKSAVGTGLFSMGIGQAASTYGENRQAGFSVPRSTAHAAITYAAEVIPERVALKPLMELGGDSLLKAVGKFFGREFIGEEATTVVGFANDKLSHKPDATVGDLLHDMVVTLGSTAISAPIQGGVGSVVGTTIRGGEGTQVPTIAPVELTPDQADLSSNIGLNRQVREESSAPIIPVAEPGTELDRMKEVFATQPQTPEEDATKWSELSQLRQQTANEIVSDPVQRVMVAEVDNQLGRTEPTISQAIEEEWVRKNTQESPTGTPQNDLGVTDQSPRTSELHQSWTEDTARALLAETRSVYSTNEQSYGSLQDFLNGETQGQVALFSRDGGALEGTDWQAQTRIVKSWLDAFLPTRRIVIGDFSLGARKNSAMYQLDPNTIAIALPKGADQLNRFITLSHEFGHAIAINEFQNAPSEVQNELMNGYHNVLRQLNDPNTTFEQGVHLFAGPKRAEQLIAQADSISSSSAPFKEVMPRILARVGTPVNYVLGVDEYLAERVSKYITSRGGVTQTAEPFFRRIVRKFAQFFKQYVQPVTHEDSFTQWLDSLAAKNSKQLIEQNAVDGLREELAQLGVNPVTINSLTIPGAENLELASSLAARIRSRGVSPFELLQGELSQALRLNDQLIEIAKGKKPKASDDFIRELLNRPEYAGRKFDANRLQWEVFNHYNPFRIVVNGTQLSVVGKKSGEQVMLVNAELSAIDGEVGANVTTIDGKKNPIALMNVQDYLRQQLATSMSLDNERMAPIPDWIYSEPHQNSLASIDFGTVVSNLRQQFGMKNYSDAKFNWLLKYSIGAFQMAQLNQHIPGVKDYRQAARNRMGYKAKWLRKANDVVRTGLDELSKDQAAKVSRVLFDEDRAGRLLSTKVRDPNDPNGYIFRLSQQEQKRLGLTQEAAEWYSEVRNTLSQALDHMQKVGMTELARIHFDPAIVNAMKIAMNRGAPLSDLETLVGATMQRMNPAKVPPIKTAFNELRVGFDQMRQKPYMPHARFGQWALKTRDANGVLTEFETFETKLERDSVANVVQRKLNPGEKIEKSYVPELASRLAGLPPGVLDALAGRLNLTPQQLAEYRNWMKDLTAGQSFLKRMKRRKGTEGYTDDALRAYSDYFRKFANYTANVQANEEFQSALNTIEEYARAGNQGDTTNTWRLYEWLNNTTRYLQSPGNELGELKSLVSLFHFAGNISSAVMNATQVPFVTLPYLSKRVGIAQAAKELTRAYKDIAVSWGDLSKLSPDEQAMIEHGLESGFLNESFATELAQISEGSALARAQPVMAARRKLAQVNHYAMWMFQKAEELNRRVTVLAAYRSNRAQSFGGTFDQMAFDLAREAVEVTQNEYSIENRPVFMRGQKSVIFQFMHFSQNMVFQMFGGDESWKRLLLTQLFLGGLLGMPFAEDLGALVKFLARQFGIDFDPEREVRMMLSDMDINADLILRGATSNVGGLDISKRISLGQLIPGVKALGSNKSFVDSIYDATGDVAGAGISLIIGAMKAIGSDNPDQLKRWSPIMPSGVRNAIRAADAINEGVTTSNGAVIYEPNLLEGMGMAIGFTPSGLSTEYNANSLKHEAALYWTRRQAALLKAYDYVMLNKDGDREGRADVMERVKEFNQSAPDPKLRISGDTLSRSLQQARRRKLLISHGIEPNAQIRQLSEQIDSALEAN